ncbi:hypothetical protein KGF54_003470 [Candida jiufengensis]|uniref:uncharacterized protein n=1 Tax=Candida jiufengensis TaxID=497108 RepID=UPI002224122C|nr:uncharacterized protein KGF54_003470 [Candida jiufengensis]KAI5952603.1 hypothetical protein KGF54_003470 [Candida jiufengensis]
MESKENNINQEEKLPQPQHLKPESHQKLKTPSTLTKDLFKWEIIIENKGSVARDHLANERTLLAWIRTSLIFITFGIGFLQFFRLEEKSNCSNISSPLPTSLTNEQNSMSSLYDKDTVDLITRLGKPLAPMCIIMGVLTFVMGFYRYLQVQIFLMNDVFPATRFFLIGLIIVNLGMLILLLVINFKIVL